MSGKYDDIIRLPHHQSSKRPHMSRMNRAAQFSPFAALTGYDGAVAETARLTDHRIELDEDALLRLDAKMQQLRERMEGTITYFVPDRRKDGGAYVTVRGRIKKFKDFEGLVLMEDGTIIPIPEIIEIVL